MSFFCIKSCFWMVKVAKIKMQVIGLVLALCSYVAYAAVTITKYETCDNKDYPIKFSFKIKEENGVQMLEEGHLITKVPLGNDIKDIAEVFSKEDNGQYEHLITVNENLCDAVNKYMGDFMHDIQEAAGLARGQCPVPPGDYKIKDHPLDYSRFKFKKVPDGDFRVKVSMLDAKTNETLHCYELDFTIKH